MWNVWPTPARLALNKVILDKKNAIFCSLARLHCGIDNINLIFLPYGSYSEVSIVFGYCSNFTYLLFYVSWIHVWSFKIIDHPESEKIMIEKEV